MEKDKLIEKELMVIDADALKKLNISINEVVEYLETKKAVTLKPIHVKAHQYWKSHPAVSSS